jgi:hypothetical protein
MMMTAKMRKIQVFSSASTNVNRLLSIANLENKKSGRKTPLENLPSANVIWLLPLTLFYHPQKINATVDN